MLPMFTTKEANVGIYVFNIKTLLNKLPKISNINKKEEYSLTDGVEIISQNREKIGSDTVIYPSVVIEENVTLGLLTRLRPGTVLKKGSRVGNFVEMKKTIFGEGSKAGHLSYLGDSVVGKEVNIGAGTITCNYGGRKKNKMIIEDGTFIGSGVELVAPVKIGKKAYIRAGSTITKDVSPYSLAVERSPQRERRVG